MAVQKKTIEKLLEPYICNGDGYLYPPEDMVDAASEMISQNYESIYAMVEENKGGGRKFIVGNLTSRVKKPIYEIYIR